jgi:hypothetical protein
MMKRVALAAILVTGGCLAWAGSATAAERDLHSGLAHLRAGAQAEAERDLTRFRDEERDPEVRRKIDRVLFLLRRPLTPEVREYVATTIEEAVPPRATVRMERGRPSYWSRMFPVFP